jgi:hypothetical protein
LEESFIQPAGVDILEGEIVSLRDIQRLKIFQVPEEVFCGLLGSSRVDGVGTIEGSGATAAVPFKAQNTAEGLKPTGMRHAPQHFLRFMIRNDKKGDLTGKLYRPVEEPWRCLAVVQR